MQTRITTMLCGAAALLATAAAPALAATCGDVNNDGSVAINDVSVHLRVVSGLDAASGICGGSGYANCANLNGDAITSSADIDFLYGQLGTTPADPWLLDLNLDGLIDKADVDTLVTGLLSTRYGDADLNRAVDFSDLLVLAKNYNHGGNWSAGDFDGTGGAHAGSRARRARRRGGR